MQAADGVGVRHATPLGPIRLDYAFRVYPKLEFVGDSVWDFFGRHLYIGIGQAF